ncbi:PucR family transcriptional regulator [Clostridium thailandense]|uniref:PucR family transcriptional regulator n=1 Tax=Clostridium thailandense TaxID=2794346 RepID=UPI00398907EE
MQITIDKLLKQLENFQPICRTMKNNSFSITSVCFFTKDTNFTNTEFLYIGYASELLSENSFKDPILMICIEDIPISENFRNLREIYLIRLLADTNILSVYNTINTLFDEDILIKSFTEKLYQSIVLDFDIQAICDLAATFLQNPLVVLDNSLKHIGISSDVELEDHIWMDQQKNGNFISEHSIGLITKQTEYKKDYYSTEPVILPKGELKYPRIINHIFVNHKPVGTIVIFEVHKKFKNMDLYFAKMISDVLSLRMKNDSFVLYSKGVIYEHIFYDLLNETISSSVLYERIQSQNLNIKDDIYVIAIDISEFDQTYKTLQYFRSLLDEIIRDGKSVIYENYIVVIIMRKSNTYLSELEINEINNFCGKKKLYAGISKCFHDVSKLKFYFEQAITSLQLNRKLRKVHKLSFYEEFTTDHMIDIAFKNIDLKQFCDESLLKLIEYDKFNNTTFASSLYEFLIHERNLAHTAKALHMHRNTLIYRINKIQEITNHDLENSNYRFRLLLSFKILSFLESIDFTK